MSSELHVHSDSSALMTTENIHAEDISNIDTHTARLHRRYDFRVIDDDASIVQSQLHETKSSLDTQTMTLLFI